LRSSCRNDLRPERASGANPAPTIMKALTQVVTPGNAPQ
jgi:hypothetical protein